MVYAAMKYYPALLDLKGKRCCVIGGGAVACRKARSLLAAGAAVTVIAPRLSKDMEGLAAKREVHCIRQAYQSKYIRGSFLVIAATADPRVNSRVSSDAARLRVLSNIVDCPSKSDFIVPSVLHKQGLIIAVSTSGLAPSLSRQIRLDLREKLVKKYALALVALAKERKRLRGTSACFARRKHLLACMARKELRAP